MNFEEDSTWEPRGCYSFYDADAEITEARFNGNDESSVKCGGSEICICKGEVTWQK